MVKVELHKYGKVGSVNIEDDVDFHSLARRLKDLTKIMKDTVLDMGIEPYDKAEEE